MNNTNCCVCFKENAHIPLSKRDSNKETITSKLRKVVSDVVRYMNTDFRYPFKN